VLAEQAGADARDHARLAIAIPAYGRAAAIASSIANMADQARADDLDIVFHVSDDTPDSSVHDALQPLIEAGLPVLYRQNVPALRHDRNLIATLLWPNADYVWLLGSAHTVKPGQLVCAYRFLDDQDLVLTNNHFPDDSVIPLLRGEAARACLRDRLWHQTLTGVTLYGQRVREWVADQGEALKVFPDFPQISVMLGYASDHELSVGVFGQRVLQSSGSETASYWRSRAVEVFVDHWSAVVTAFPRAVPPVHRARVVREHSARTDLFNTTYLIGYRISGQFSWKSMTKRHFREAMHLPLWKLLILVALPVPVLNAGGPLLAQVKRLIGKS